MRSFYMLFFTFCSFLSADEDFYQKKFNVIETAQLRVAVNHFYELTEEAMSQRGRLLQFVNLYKADRDKVLNGKDLEDVLSNLKSQLSLRASLYKFIQTYKSRPFLEKGESVLYSETNIIKGGMIAIAAASVLYDNYSLCLSVVQDNSKLRRLLNKGDKGLEIEEDAFEEIVESFHSPKNRSLMRDAMDWYNEKSKKVNEIKDIDRQVKYLKNLLDSSPSIRDIQDGFGFGDYIKLVGLVKYGSKDSVASLGSGSIHGISKVFGNSLGLVQTRDGRLFEQETKVSEIKKQLKPLDILLEKTPFRLTDKFIPGHFGHVAIWMGSEQDLKKAGLWDHPAVKPWQKQISAGKCVLEALRDGVQLNTFERFMNVDDVAVLRADKFNFNETALRGFRQLGKEYDFNFDVETIDKIVCSELVYQVFVNYQWPTEKTLGRHTISPDNVAVKALGGPLKLILFYHDGSKSDGNKYKELLEK